MTANWFDTRGCLSAAGVQVMRDAVPGTAPPEVAGHVAGCASCQDRMLALEGTVPKKARPTELQRWRLPVLMGAVFLAGLLALWTVWRMLGG